MITTTMTRYSKGLASLAVTAWVSLLSYAQPLPQDDNLVHLGVASCASGVCHGSVQQRDASRVLQNEFVVWSRQDIHAKAYDTLLNPESKRIARNLGLKNAHEADLCLDCHADNVKSQHRGERFQIDDGIGCEACHGGAENYISSHTDTANSRDQIIKDGLYPTDQPVQRAAVCLSCHLGNGNKFATHEIMGAGHPRLSFELDTFGALQPYHYQIDDDYLERKWAGDSFTTWAIGQLEAAKATLSAINGRLKNKNKTFPELALFDCHSCHHDMSDQRWQQKSYIGLPPGAVRLNDGNFVMLMALANAIDAPASRAIHSDLRRLQKAANGSGSVSNATSKLSGAISNLQNALQQSSSSDLRTVATKALDEVLKMGAKGTYSDYITAEQAVMAVDLMLITISRKADFVDTMDGMYNVVGNEDKFKPRDLKNRMARLKSAI